MNTITSDLLEEFIKILESPQSLKSEQRFRLLEKAYLERDKRKRGPNVKFIGVD